jgi:hypothetical protein
MLFSLYIAFYFCEVHYSTPHGYTLQRTIGQLFKSPLREIRLITQNDYLFEHCEILIVSLVQRHFR